MCHDIDYICQLTQLLSARGLSVCSTCSTDPRNTLRKVRSVAVEVKLGQINHKISYFMRQHVYVISEKQTLRSASTSARSDQCFCLL